MRLLKVEDDGAFSLVEYFGYDVPPYAILSHTWNSDESEITFKDIIKGRGESKSGYQKLIFCAQQAAKDGLQFFWIDTCCIDKSSSAELMEAINLMFLWYKEAQKCYAYLADVPFSSGNYIQAFRSSRWFTRGWTLQELLAPPIIEFYSFEGELLGDRDTLAQEVHEITQIPITALERKPLSQFSVDERLSWAERRETKRVEDAAYCLLGIFDVHMPLVYGEGKVKAFKRFLRTIYDSGLNEFNQQNFHGMLDIENSTMDDLHLPISSNQKYLSPENHFNNESDDESDIASTVFSDGGISNSSASSVGIINPVRTSGIREVSQALLHQEDLKALYTTAVQKLEQRKARTHIRGYLKEYGRNLVVEAGQSNLQSQAAKFVQELAGRIAEEIRFSIAGLDNNDGYILPLDTATAKKNLEGWLSSLQPQSKMVAPAVNPEDMFEGIDSDDEIDESLQFPNIELVRDFLVHSEAFKTLVKAMQTWLKVGDGHARDTYIEKAKTPLNTDETAGPNRSHISEPSVLDLLELGDPTEDLTESKTADDTAQEMAGEPQADQGSSDPIPKGANPIETSTSTVAGVPQEVEFNPISLQNYDKLDDLMSGLLDYWGISFFLYDLIEILVPSVPQGYKRLRWRCSCNTVLWGDFPADDKDALIQLKQELAWWDVSPTHQRPSQTTLAPPPSTSSGAPHTNPPDSSTSAVGVSNVQATGTSIPTPSKISNSSGSVAPHVVNIRLSPCYFEVCVSIADNDISHHEIDISDIDTDGELFERIWDKYNNNRGLLRRLFLRPSNVHFVMFSVNQLTNYGTGIHKKPNEFPPQQELDERRYHYLCPKIQMPVNTFLHYLHRARWSVWGEHTGNAWLKRLPKKLEDSMLQHHPALAAQPSNDSDPDLRFGWGVHILDGPNHAVLGLVLCVCVTVASVVSALLVGLAKTQEQGFGVGSFLLAILGGLMAAVYFKLQDR